MDKKKSFILHYDSLSVIDKMSDDQTWKLLRMMKSYHNGNTYTCDDFAVELVFEQFKNQFDRDLEAYNDKCKRNAENWQRWWRPRNPEKPNGYFENPLKAKKPYKDNDSDNDNKNDKDTSRKKSTTFTAPTIDDVISYFNEKWYREDIAKKAREYYDVANRSDSKWNKVRNWKQKMQSVWFKEEHEDKSYQLPTTDIEKAHLYVKIGRAKYKELFWIDETAYANQQRNIYLVD